MITKQVPRGATVDVRVTFRTGDGDLFMPDEAVLYINFQTHTGARSTVEIEMTPDDASWIGRWDSSGAAPGQVDWHARGFAGDAKSAAQGEFVLIGNRGNPEE